MTKERLEEILNNILDWGAEHEEEFKECLLSAMDLTDEEVKELRLTDYVSEEEDLTENLPKEDSIGRPSNLETDDDFEEYISDYLSDKYGYCVNSFNYDFDINRIYIYNIDWDTKE